MELGGVHGGVEARLIGGTLTPATAGRGEARKSFATARWCSCARKGGERWSGEARSTEWNTSASSAKTPARDSWGRGASHGLPRRARGARGGGDAQGKMEMAPTHWSGRNGQPRRWRVVEASATAAACASGGERAKWRSEEERSAVGQVKARQEGAGQDGAAARRARRRMVAMRRAHYDMARRVRGGQARRAGAGARR